jgi:integrase
VRLDSANLNFHRDFINHLRVKEVLNENTIGSVISNIKVFLRDAQRYNYNVHQDYTSKDFYIPSSVTNDPYFTENEMEIIKDTAFVRDGYLDNARDWLIIGVRTGLRISDFLKLKRENYNDGFIENKNFKTGVPVIIPIHPNVQYILDKRDGNLPRPISDQNFNIYIKEVAFNCGIKELISGGKMSMVRDGYGNDVSRKVIGMYPKFGLVTSHICRRTFATHLYGKIDTLTIMKITGHKTEKQFLDYVKITPKEYAIRLKEHWLKST